MILPFSTQLNGKSTYFVELDGFKVLIYLHIKYFYIFVTQKYRKEKSLQQI